MWTYSGYFCTSFLPPSNLDLSLHSTPSYFTLALCCQAHGTTRSLVLHPHCLCTQRRARYYHSVNFQDIQTPLLVVHNAIRGHPFTFPYLAHTACRVLVPSYQHCV